MKRTTYLLCLLLAVALTACDAPDGYVDASGDCDDANANIHPDADEVCDGAANSTLAASAVAVASGDVGAEVALTDDAEPNAHPAAHRNVHRARPIRARQHRRAGRLRPELRGHRWLALRLCGQRL